MVRLRSPQALLTSTMPTSVLLSTGRAGRIKVFFLDMGAGSGYIDSECGGARQSREIVEKESS